MLVALLGYLATQPPALLGGLVQLFAPSARTSHAPTVRTPAETTPP